VLADSDTAAGNFVKVGTGTQALTGANTYSGSTTVNGGTLAISTAYLNDSSTVSIANGAVLQLTHALTDTINELWVGGVQQSPGIYSVSNSAGFITGTGSLNVLNGQPSQTRQPLETPTTTASPIYSNMFSKAVILLPPPPTFCRR
jgi:autotransporter-associated beta strand protein